MNECCAVISAVKFITGDMFGMRCLMLPVQDFVLTQNLYLLSCVPVPICMYRY